MKPGARIVLTGTRPAKSLVGKRGVLLWRVDNYGPRDGLGYYWRMKLDGDGEGVEREFPESEFTLEEVYDSPLWKALR